MWNTASGQEMVQYEGLHADGDNISKCAISYDNNRYVCFDAAKLSEMVKALQTVELRLGG